MATTKDLKKAKVKRSDKTQEKQTQMTRIDLRGGRKRIQ